MLCVLLVARRRPQRLGLAWERIGNSIDMWFAIIEHLGRMGWPNEGREALARAAAESGDLRVQVDDGSRRGALARGTRIAVVER